MITEDYVSFEVAKLLKDKGFDCPCEVWYSEYTSQFFRGEKYTIIEFDDHNRFNENYKFLCYAPTLQMAMKWLRETFEIHCQIDCPIAASNWMYGIRDLNKDEWVTLRNMGDYDTYEEACEAGIRYVLENLI